MLILHLGDRKCGHRLGNPRTRMVGSLPTLPGFIGFVYDLYPAERYLSTPLLYTAPLYTAPLYTLTPLTRPIPLPPPPPIPLHCLAIISVSPIHEPVPCGLSSSISFLPYLLLFLQITQPLLPSLSLSLLVWLFSALAIRTLLFSVPCVCPQLCSPSSSPLSTAPAFFSPPQFPSLCSSIPPQLSLSLSLCLSLALSVCVCVCVCVCACLSHPRFIDVRSGSH